MLMCNYLCEARTAKPFALLNEQHRNLKQSKLYSCGNHLNVTIC